VMTLVMFLVMMPMMGHGMDGGMGPDSMRGGMGCGMDHGNVAGDHHEGANEDPGAIAARRYAHGDISREEYLTIKRDLEGRDR